MLSGLAMLVLVVSSAPPAEGFLFGLLRGFFQPFPLLNIPTYAQRTAVGGIYINAFPFTTPPAADCFTRALGLLNGCQPFLNALNANGGQLSLFSIFQILNLAKNNITGDITCYNAAASFLNGGCICDNGLINTINVLNTVPAFAKQALTTLNKAKCPPSPPPPPVAPFVAMATVPPPVFVAPPTMTQAATSVPSVTPTPPAMAPTVIVNVPAPAPVAAAAGAGAVAGRRLFWAEEKPHADRLIGRRLLEEAEEGPKAYRLVR